MSWSRARTRLPVEPVGAVCGVQGVVGNAPSALRQSTPRVSRAFSTAPAGSTGRLEPGGSVAGVADVIVLGARCDVVAGRVLMSSPFAYQPQTTKGRNRNGNDKQERTKEGRTKEGRRTDEGRTEDGRRKDGGRTKEGRRTEQTITSPTRISACRSPVPPIDRGRCQLAGIPLEALPPNIVIVVATQENVARPLPGEGTHDVAGVGLRWKRTGVEHWVGVVPSQAVETEGGGTCRRQRTW